MKIRECWQPILCPKSCTSLDLLLIHCPWYNNLFTITFTNIILVNLKEPLAFLDIQSLTSSFVFYSRINFPAISIISMILLININFVNIRIRLRYLLKVLFEKAIFLYKFLNVCNLSCFVKWKLHFKLPLISSIYFNIIFELVLVGHVVVKAVLLLV